MKKYYLFLYCTIFSFFLIHSTWAAQPPASSVVNTKIVFKDKVPEGVMIKNNKVIAKKGYMFKKVSNHRASLMARRGHGITGDFDCTCNGTSGGCVVSVTPTSVSCSVGSCTSSCYMIVNIPGNTTNILH